MLTLNVALADKTQQIDFHYQLNVRESLVLLVNLFRNQTKCESESEQT